MKWKVCVFFHLKIILSYVLNQFEALKNISQKFLKAFTNFRISAKSKRFSKAFKLFINFSQSIYNREINANVVFSTFFIRQRKAAWIEGSEVFDSSAWTNFSEKFHPPWTENSLNRTGTSGDPKIYPSFNIQVLIDKHFLFSFFYRIIKGRVPGRSGSRELF